MPLGSFGSSGIVRFTSVPSVGHWVYPPSFGSLGWALGVGSSRVVRFTLVLPGGRWVFPVSLGSHGCTLWDVGFFLGIWGHSYAPWGSPLRSMGSSGVVCFTRLRPGGRWVHPGSLGSLVYAQGVIGFVSGRWVLSSLRSSRVIGSTPVRTVDRWVLPES